MTEEQQKLYERKAELFVGENYGYYEKQWRGRMIQQNFSSWNWAAFFFPLYWLVYRKMYLEGFLFGVITLFTAIIPGSGLILHILVGIYANSYYRKRELKVMVQTNQLTEWEAIQYIKKHGGTNVLGIFVALLITVFLAFAIIAGIALFTTGENKINSQSVQYKTEAGSLNINAGVQDVINNLNQYTDYFKDNQLYAEIVTYDDKECLKIKFTSNVEALYGPDLIKINNKILYKHYDKEYLVNLEIYNIDPVKKTARVSTEYDGGYGTTVCYYLPDFYDMKPDWGDYLQADLDIKKVISKEELKELYCTAQQMKEMINNEYMWQNQTKSVENFPQT